MKDYIYYIPGYTGFCPDLPNHFGESYGKATHQIIRQRPRDLLRERLSDVRYGERKRGTYYNAYQGDHWHNSKYVDCCKKSCCDSCCRKCRRRDECIYKLPKYSNNKGFGKGMAGRQNFVCPTYVYVEGYAGRECDEEEMYCPPSPRKCCIPPKKSRPCCNSCCDRKVMHHKQYGSMQDKQSYTPGIKVMFDAPCLEKLFKRHEKPRSGRCYCCC
ncbi:uncharacterized protein [Parasteatoda tepidariorum]|uniref:uncharacterized protein n=1 Tax=Parasteatoda tepidariorum TaxID=114398 RepID=UPI0039BC44B3